MTDGFAIAVRFALYADLLVLFGLAVFAVQNQAAVARDMLAGSAMRRGLAIAMAVAIFLSAASLAQTAAAMAGLPIGQLDLATVRTVALETPFGTALLVRCLALAMALIACLFLRSPMASWSIIAGASGAGAASLAWGGHAMMDEGSRGWIHLAADVLHLLAAGLWIGALVGLVVLLYRQSASMGPDYLALSHRALARFAPMGTLIVAVITLSGFVNGWMLIGPSSIGALWTTRYGILLLAKLGLFVLMLVLAAVNRFWLTPGLAAARADHRAAVRALRQSLALETGSAFAILGLVAWLGMLEPPMASM